MESTFVKIQSLESAEVMDRLTSFFGDILPLEVRFFLSSFLDTRLVNKTIPSVVDQQFKNDAKNFTNSLVAEIYAQASKMTGFDMIAAKLRLQKAAQSYQASDPCVLYSHLIKCLLFEQNLLNESNGFSSVNDITYLTQAIANLASNVEENEGFKDKWMGSRTNYYVECNSNPTSTDCMDSEMVDEPTLDMILKPLLLDQQMIEGSDSVINQYWQTLNTAKELVLRVIQEYLPLLKRPQRPQNDILIDTLQRWYESLIGSLLKTREQIWTMQTVDQYSQSLHDLDTAATNHIEKLISRSLVFTKEPSRVVEKGVKLSSTPELRLLVANITGIRKHSTSVSASIITESQMHQLITSEKFTGNTFGRFQKSSDQSCMEYCGNNRHMTAKFPKMKLEEFVRPESSLENVTDEKLAFLFQTTLEIQDMVINVWEISRPIVVTVHHTQDWKAWATIFWDNHFPEPHRNTFAVSAQVTWSCLADALSRDFGSVNKKDLDDFQLHFLAEKFYNRQVPYPVPDSFIVTWQDFFNRAVNGCNFSFAQWFYATLRVTKDHMQKIWEAGLIVGFISKTRVADYLNACTEGTFMMRFSDSRLGHVSIAWVSHGMQPSVQHIQPLGSKDFAACSLASYVLDIVALTVLHPNTPKTIFIQFKETPKTTGQTTRALLNSYVLLKRRMEVQTNSQ